MPNCGLITDFLLPSARMRERVTVVTLCVCLLFIVEKALFSELNLHQYIDSSVLNVPLF